MSSRASARDLLERARGRPSHECRTPVPSLTLGMTFTFGAPATRMNAPAQPDLPVSPHITFAYRAARTAALCLTGAAGLAVAQAPAPASPSRLTVERIFATGEFASRGAGQLRWLDDSTYVALQGNQQAGGAELARFNARTGAREVMVPASWLTPN